ncbi:hypothetical protein K6119_08155 [Paracrocinitomix mangrovi]|uniref:hypothetical protein n=1 Tax=Paracrocinitomix mangrovi TaxID=2862509 RepID=UPI001C8D4E4C|nr:hypothetical protein [Paracrocinitomix mangrovi]UKN03485.1 hypothetical protein K6119_08155 [Paracrocinitomix mangrovi]
MSNNEIITNELGTFTWNEFDSTYEGMIESETLGYFHLSFTTTTGNISKNQIDSFLNIKSNWEKIKQEISGSLGNGLTMQKCKLGAIIIPDENNSEQPIEIAFNCKKNLFSRRHIVCAIYKNWKLEEIFYL